MNDANLTPDPANGEPKPSSGTPDPSPEKKSSLRIGVVVVGVLAVFAAGLFTGTFITGDEGSDSTPVPPAAAQDTDDGPASGSPEAGAEAVDSAPTASGAGAAAGQSGGVVFNPFTAVDYGSGPCAPVEGAAEPVLDFADAPALCIDPAASHTAVIETSAGTVEVALDAANTPGTVNNFVNLARFGYYDNTLIHRSDPSIGILQAGSPHTNDLNDPGPGYTIWDEGSGFAYQPGLIAMARTQNPNSADAQFFFTVTDAATLLNNQGDSVVFGQITRGLDVLTAILDTHQPQPGNDFGGTPNPPTTINTITIHTTGTASEAGAEVGAAGGDSTGAEAVDSAPTASGAGAAAGQSGGVVFNPFTAVDYGSGPCAPVEGAAEPVLDFADAPALCIDPAASHTAVIETSAGTVEVALDAANTPGTVNNFVNLARFGYYDNTLIHRSDPSIGILQAGSPHTNDLNDPGPGYTIWDEGSGFAYQPGLIAMARTQNPNSADAQFFFTVTDAATLLNNQGDSVVFGQITRGLDVLTAILDTHQPQPGNDFGGTPNPPTTINTITIHTTPS